MKPKGKTNRQTSSMRTAVRCWLLCLMSDEDMYKFEFIMVMPGSSSPMGNLTSTFEAEGGKHPLHPAFESVLPFLSKLAILSSSIWKCTIKYDQFWSVYCTILPLKGLLGFKRMKHSKCILEKSFFKAVNWIEDNKNPEHVPFCTTPLQTIHEILPL